MKFEKNVMVKKYNDGVIEEVEDVILREFLLDININSKPIVKLLCIEKDLQELVTGYLITENIVRPEDIQNVDIKIDGNVCDVTLKDIDNTPSHVTTESGDYKNVPYNFTNRDEKVTPIDWDEETLLKISNFNLSGSQLFKET
ncbi:MAG: formate dehydrogenase accessory sulfurtransferase FdhD, partial [Finegoldia magna]|nr:formate dehydrogenase accessory sulfurtransferase FdhD [Finegoldia magna]